MLLVNSKALNSESGYKGHRILAYGYDADGVICMDPGPTYATGARKIAWSMLEYAWAYPDDRLKEMLVVGKPTHLKKQEVKE